MAKKKTTINGSTINISQKLYKKIIDYCSLNEFSEEETNKFIEECLEKGFMIELYGIKPQISKPQMPQVQNTIVVEQSKPEETKIDTTVVETVKEKEEIEPEVNVSNTKNVNLEITEDKPKIKRRKLT